MEVLGNLNWLAILLATAVYFAIGFAWYSLLFGNAWMRAMGKTAEELQGGAGPGYAIAVVGELISVIVLAVVMRAMGFTGLVEGALIGLLVSLGIHATSSGVEYIFSGRSVTLYLINVGYAVVALTIVGAILGAWR